MKKFADPTNLCLQAEKPYRLGLALYFARAEIAGGETLVQLGDGFFGGNNAALLWKCEDKKWFNWARNSLESKISL